MRKPQVGGGLRSGTGALQQFSAAGCLDSRYRPCQPPRRRAALGPCCGSVAARRRRRCAWAVGALLGAGSARCKARTKTLSAEGSENASFAARWPSCAALGQLRFFILPTPKSAAVESVLSPHARSARHCCRGAAHGQYSRGCTCMGCTWKPAQLATHAKHLGGG